MPAFARKRGAAPPRKPEFTVLIDPTRIGGRHQAGLILTIQPNKPNKPNKIHCAG